MHRGQTQLEFNKELRESENLAEMIFDFETLNDLEKWLETNIEPLN